MPDLARIKRNVAKMASMNAPEHEIDDYISHEGVTVDDVRNFKMGAFTSTPQNVAHETVTKDDEPNGLLYDAAMGAPSAAGRFLAGAGGEITNMAKGAGQTVLEGLRGVIDPLGSQGLDDPMANPVKTTISQGLQHGTDALKEGVTQTRQDIDNMGTAGKFGKFTADVIPALMTKKAIPAAIVGAVQGLTTPEGTGETVNRTLRGGVEGTLNAVAPKAGDLLAAGARKVTSLLRPGAVLSDAMGVLKDAPQPVQEQVFTYAQDLIDHGRTLGVTVTGPEAVQQALEDLGIGAAPRLGTLQRSVENAPKGEAAMAAVTGKRAGQVENAGRRVQRETFGDAATPEDAVQATNKAAGGALKEAVNARTAASEGSFQTAAERMAKPGSQTVSDIAALKKEIDAQIALKGSGSGVGRKLAAFRKQLDQGIADTGEQSLGPLQQANRETAINLRQKYNPQDPDNTYNNMEAGVIGPFNEKLTNLLTRDSPDYGQALTSHIAASPDVNAMQYGAVGRMANQETGDVSARLTAMSNEFLNPEIARPQTIRKLAADLGKQDPTVVPKLVGARIGNIFRNATRQQQGGANPWGGANFVKDLMGNSQARQNLEATVKTLPDGARKWAAWNKFATVLKATGKRKPIGSETAQNLGMDEALKQGLSAPAQVLSNPMAAGANLLCRPRQRRQAVAGLHPSPSRQGDAEAAVGDSHQPQGQGHHRQGSVHPQPVRDAGHARHYRLKKGACGTPSAGRSLPRLDGLIKTALSF